MKIGALTLFAGNGSLASWHWPRSLTWRWSLTWDRNKSDPWKRGYYARWRPHAHLIVNVPLLGCISFQAQGNLWRSANRYPLVGYPIRHPRQRQAAILARGQCPECGGELDTGNECNECGFDAMPELGGLRALNKVHRGESEPR
jgi:hypothetical protein